MQNKSQDPLLFSPEMTPVPSSEPLSTPLSVHVCPCAHVSLRMWLVTVTLCVSDVTSATACGWHLFSFCWGQLGLHPSAYHAPILVRTEGASPTSVASSVHSGQP